MTEIERQRVLIVDDDARNQRIALELLEDLVECKTASSGDEALQVLCEFKPDLILLDIMMPGTDGYETCQKIRENPVFKFAKIILVSGKAMTDEKLKGYQSGADDYVTKPFVHEELLAKVKVYLRLNYYEKDMKTLNDQLDAKIREITFELKEAQAVLIHNAKMTALGEMAGGVAHEINNPLTTIGLITEQIKSFVEKDPLKWQDKIITQSELVLKSVNHIATIVRGLNTFSRNTKDEPMTSSCLKNIVRDALNLCQAKLKQLGVEVLVNDFDEKIYVQCRPIQISQVILNLISNAGDAVSSVPDGWIKIEVSVHHPYVNIYVRDNGKGVPEDLREKIFQPLFTTKDVGKGTGLGLSISKGIVDNHKGRLLLSKASPYTEFTLSLLVEDPPQIEKSY